MTLLSHILPAFSADTVAVFQQSTGLQLFIDARPVKLEVNEASRYMTHPTELATVVIDHKVDLPISITISFILRPQRFRNTYKEFRNAKNRATTLIVQTRTSRHRNLYIESIPRVENVEKFDTITMEVRFIENLALNQDDSALGELIRTGIDILMGGNVAELIDGTTVDEGLRALGVATDDQATTASALFQNARALF